MHLYSVRIFICFAFSQTAQEIDTVSIQLGFKSHPHKFPNIPHHINELMPFAGLHSELLCVVCCRAKQMTTDFCGPLNQCHINVHQRKTNEI